MPTELQFSHAYAFHSTLYPVILTGVLHAALVAKIIFIKQALGLDGQILQHTEVDEQLALMQNVPCHGGSPGTA